MGQSFGSEPPRATSDISAKIVKAAKIPIRRILVILWQPSGLTKPSGEQRGAGLRWIQALGLHPAAIDYEGLIGAHAAVIGG